jgi:hypothetical protein
MIRHKSVATVEGAQRLAKGAMQRMLAASRAVRFSRAQLKLSSGLQPEECRARLQRAMEKWDAAHDDYLAAGEAIAASQKQQPVA